MSARSGVRPPSSWSLRTRALLVGAVVAIAVAVLAAGGFENTLTYYRTPTEVQRTPPEAGQTLRVGGLVVKGTVRSRGDVVRFRLTDGATDLEVVSTGSPPSTFRAGKGAVVEGRLSGDGVFHAQRVLVRHSNEYEPPGGGTRAGARR